MKKIRVILSLIKWKLKNLFRKNNLLELSNNCSVSDLFLGDSFCVSYINPYQEQLLKQNILIENGVKKDFSKNVYQQNGLNKIELGILNKNTLIHLAKLYKNSLKQSNMIIVDSKSNQGFVLDNLDIKRKVCIDSLNGYAKEVARNLKGNRVLVISRAAYLIKTQYSKFDKININCYKDFKLLALNPFNELLITANGQYFNTYDELKILMLKLDFDIVLFDDSLFALPLASFASGLQKKALLLGDGLLEIFGIVHTKGELNNKDDNWASLDSYDDEITSEFLATGQIPEIK